MSRYIDADLLEVDLWDNPNAWTDEEMGFSRAQIDRQPTADVQEIVHGHWEYRHNDDYIDNEQIEWLCSSCQTIFDEWNGTYEDFTHPDWEFCPYCGAIMDEEAN